MLGWSAFVSSFYILFLANLGTNSTNVVNKMANPQAFLIKLEFSKNLQVEFEFFSFNFASSSSVTFSQFMLSSSSLQSTVAFIQYIGFGLSSG